MAAFLNGMADVWQVGMGVTCQRLGLGCWSTSVRVSWASGDQDVQYVAVGEDIPLALVRVQPLAPLNRTTVASVDDGACAYAHARVESLRHLSRTAPVVSEDGAFHPIDVGFSRTSG